MLHRSRVVEARILAIVLGSLAVRTTSLRTTVGTALVAPWDQNMENGTRTKSMCIYKSFEVGICVHNLSLQNLGHHTISPKAQIQAKVVLHGAPMSGRDLVGSQAFSGSESRARIQRCMDTQFKTRCKHRNWAIQELSWSDTTMAPSKLLLLAPSSSNVVRDGSSSLWRLPTLFS